MSKVAVVGAGTMGNGIAHVFALHKFEVFLVDTNTEQLDRAKLMIDKNLSRQVQKEIISEEQKHQALENLMFLTSITDLDSDVSIAIEAVFEDEIVKKTILQALEKKLPSAILASNTSSISITQLASVLDHPDQFIGMHFMNPVPIMELVELIRGYSTSDKTVAMIESITKKLGKIPITVNDYPGFVANRILMPMLNEAITTLFEGVAGVQEIDNVMKLGMAHPMGPLQLADFIGLDVCLNILNVLYKGFGNPKYAPCPLLVNMVASGNLGAKSGEGFYDWSEGNKSLTVAYNKC